MNQPVCPISGDGTRVAIARRFAAGNFASHCPRAPKFTTESDLPTQRTLQ
jgi:hypothetical protein